MTEFHRGNRSKLLTPPQVLFFLLVVVVWIETTWITYHAFFFKADTKKGAALRKDDNPVTPTSYNFLVESQLPSYLYVLPLLEFFTANDQTNKNEDEDEDEDKESTQRLKRIEHQAKSMALVEQYTGKENLLWKKLAHIHHGKYPRVPLSLRPRAPAFEGVGFPSPSVAYHLLSDVVRVLEDNKIRYVMYGGSVLSYCRHGGHMIPFDDDIDILIAANDASQLIHSLRRGGKIGAVTDKEGGAIRADGKVKFINLCYLAAACTTHEIYLSLRLLQSYNLRLHFECIYFFVLNIFLTCIFSLLYKYTYTILQGILLKHFMRDHQK